MPIDETVLKKWESHWKGRFTAMFDTNLTAFPPTFEDTIAYATDLRAPKILYMNVEEMSLAHWSELLLLALQDATPDDPGYAPLWMVMPALDRLGLAAVIRPLMNQISRQKGTPIYRKRLDVQLADEQISDWLTLPRFKAKDLEVRPTALVLADSPATLTDTWKPSAKFAGILIKREVLSNYQRPLNLIFNNIPDQLNGQQIDKLILNEFTSDGQPQLGPISELPTAVTDYPVVHIVPEVIEEVRSQRIVIRNPRSFEEAVERALQSLRRSDRAR